MNSYARIAPAKRSANGHAASAPHRAAAGAAQAARLRCADGRELAAHWFPAPRRRAVLLLNPATGFPQGFYFSCADTPAERGYDMLRLRLPRHGASAPADLVRQTCRMSDWGLLDMRAALAAAPRNAPR